MSKNILAIILVGVGTYLIRYFPIYINKKIENKNKKIFNLNKVNEFLNLSSTSLISALFVTSFIKFPINIENVLQNIIPLICVFIFYEKYNDFALSILVGIFMHYILYLIINKIGL